MKDGKFLTLGIETSCDETAIAVLADGRTVLSNVISSQVDIFRNYGGVVPEIASRHHLENINDVLSQSLSEAGKTLTELQSAPQTSDCTITLDDIDLIGVTNGPGLVGALLMGVSTAKAIAFAKDKHLVGVHHLMSHISANFIEYPELEPPFLALITSGGHTEIVMVNDYNCCEILGGTRDDAVGEAYDKVARVLGLGYPGGPKIDRLAKEGDPEAVHFKRVYLDKDSFDFSFSGLKTSVLNYINQQKQSGKEINRADVAASFQEAVMDVICDKAVHAARIMKQDKLVLAGGVAANSRLREKLGELCKQEGICLYRPAPLLCTDNGAMVACAAYYKYMKSGEDGLEMDADPGLPLEES